MSQRRARGLVVDWGGVLTTPIYESYQAWMAREGVIQESLDTTFRLLGDDPGSSMYRLERGQAALEEFQSALAAGLRRADGQQVVSHGLVDRMLASLRLNPEVLGLVTEVRILGWRTAILSNSWGLDHYEPFLKSAVDACLFSGTLAARKPDREAFEAAAAALGLSLDRCVFVDDVEHNVTAASQLGMQGFLYEPGRERELRAFIAGSCEP